MSVNTLTVKLRLISWIFISVATCASDRGRKCRIRRGSWLDLSSGIPDTYHLQSGKIISFLSELLTFSLKICIITPCEKAHLSNWWKYATNVQKEKIARINWLGDKDRLGCLIRQSFSSEALCDTAPCHRFLSVLCRAQCSWYFAMWM